MKQTKLLPFVTGAVLVAVVLAACAAPGAGSGQAQNAAQSSGQRVTVRTGAVQNRIIATGKIVARSTAQLSFSRSGAVKSVLVKVGDTVKAGQPLAALDTADLELSAKQSYANYLDALATYTQTVKPPKDADLRAAQQAVISAQEAYSTSLKGGSDAERGSAGAALRSAQAGLDNLSNPPSALDVAQQEANLRNAEADLKAKQAAYDTAFKRNPAGIGGSGEGLALQQSTNNYNAAKAAYDKLFQPATAKDIAAAKAQVASAAANLANLSPDKQKIASAAEALAQAQSKLESLTPSAETLMQAQAKLEQAKTSWEIAAKAVQDATLKAPYDGTIATVNIDVGDTAGASNAIEVADFSVPQFEVSVDEADMGGVKLGQDAIVQLQAYPNVSIPAKVERIDLTGAAASGGIVTFNVFLSISSAKTADGATATILLSMSGTSQIVTAKVDNALVVPNAALVVDATTKAYSVRKVGANGAVQTVPVTVGFRGTDSTQVTEGVSAGDVLLIPSTTTTNGGTNRGGLPGIPAGAPGGPG
jgi:RND family efflux transporter MFP subunit